MSVMVPRTVTLLAPKEDHRFDKKNLSLIEFESDFGYVLLGEPGLGKTTEFQREANRMEAPTPIPARHFLRNQYVIQHPNLPVFIDSLDEVRVKTGNPDDLIKQIISAVGDARFRLSCRSGSWLNKDTLQTISLLLGSNKIPVIQLNPLSDPAIQQIIDGHPHTDPDFQQKAHDHGLSSFLYNPQLLDLLQKAIAFNGWCSSPTEIIESACCQLVNEERLISNHDQQNPRSPDTILSRAGLLCALMLIGNKSGWELENTENQHVFSLTDLPLKDHHILNAALESPIFVGDPSYKTPIHRLIAEFLGARYLSEKIQQGLGWKRAFSLLLGVDGLPLSDLKGLAAWLSAFNSCVRSNLIHLDPSVFAFEGDSNGFTCQQRQTMIHNLENRMIFDKIFPFVPSFGAFAFPHKFSVISKLNAPSKHAVSQQNILDFLLYSFIHDESERWSHIPFDTTQDQFLEQMLKILYDPSWKLQIRLKSLNILTQNIGDKSELGPMLKSLLHDLNNTKLRDESNQIFGAVLTYSFPETLPLSELWDCLATERFNPPFDAIQDALSNLMTKANGMQIKILLNDLCDQATHIIPRLYQIKAAGIVLKLLFKGLKRFGDQIDISELYQWLELIEFDPTLSQIIPAHCPAEPILDIHDSYHASIIEWLNERKTLQYKLIECSLTNQKHQFDTCLPNKFLGTYVTYEFRSWCLNRAVELADIQLSASLQLAEWSTLDIDGWSDPLTDHQVTQNVLDCPSLRHWNELRIAQKDTQVEEMPYPKTTDITLPYFESNRQDELTYLRLRIDQVAEGRCPPDFLDKLAKMYFYGRQESHNPRDHLSVYLDKDQVLVNAVLRGFQSILDFKDLPDLEEIAEMYQRGERSYWALPFLASLEEQGESAFKRLSKEGKCRALGFYFVTEMPMQESSMVNSSRDLSSPPWYQYAQNYTPKLVADALVSIHRASVRSGSYPISHVLRMSVDESYDKVAPIAVGKKMLTIFPTKCSGLQLKSLRVTLLSILRVYSIGSNELQKDEIRTMIRKRLDRKNIDVAQQAVLLSAGLCIDHEKCLLRFREFLSAGRRARICHVLNFFESGATKILLNGIDTWKSDNLCLFIQVIGDQGQLSSFYDATYTNSKYVIPMQVKTIIKPCIEAISYRVTPQAAKALNQLVNDPNLAIWKTVIKHAKQTQTYRVYASRRMDLSLPNILQTINNGPPCFAADLMNQFVEILQDHFICSDTQVAVNWQDYWEGNTSSGKSFMPTAPKHEGAIRDQLLSSIRRYTIQNNIDVHADQWRADIRLCCANDVWIPIVIKTNLSQNIWRVMSQLPGQQSSTISIGHGNGIYLAVWFGGRYTNIVPPSGSLPKTHHQFKRLLENQLDPKSNNLISVIVINACPNSKNHQSENSPLRMPDKYFGDT